MPAIQEPARSIPVADEVDVCVIGGSCTGVFAAVAAARRGARVAIVENNGFFGGVATAGLVVIWHSLYDTQGKQEIIRGLTRETVERLLKRNAAEMGDPANPHRHVVFNPEELKIELDELVVEAGVRPFLHCRFAAPIREGDRVVAAVIEDKSGRRAIRAATFIDATGDGDLAVRAGLSCRMLDDLQPPTTCPVVYGLDAIREHHPDFSIPGAVYNPDFDKALPTGFLWTARMLGLPDCTMIAGTRMHNADCSDADQLTQAEIEGRRQARAMCDIFREQFQGGDQITLERLPAYLGIRETRHANCLHRLTEQEVLEGVRFDDAIAQGSYRVDVHHSDKPGLTFRYQDGREDYCVPGKPAKHSRWRPERDEDPTFYQIPYRALVPQGSANVLVAGRLIDADRGAYGAIRVMVNCNQTGEAAGAACALALDAHGPVADVDPAKLRASLAAHGACVV